MTKRKMTGIETAHLRFVATGTLGVEKLPQIIDTKLGSVYVYRDAVKGRIWMVDVYSGATLHEHTVGSVSSHSVSKAVRKMLKYFGVTLKSPSRYRIRKEQWEKVRSTVQLSPELQSLLKKAQEDNDPT